MNKGYIKINRKLFDGKMWLSEPFTKSQAWIDLLYLAKYKDEDFFIRGLLIKIKRGQVCMSQEKLCKRWAWSDGKLKRYLKLLESTQQITQQKKYNCCYKIKMIKLVKQWSDIKRVL